MHGVNDHKPYAQVFILHCMHRHIVQASSGHMYALAKVLNNLTGSGMCASPWHCGFYLDGSKYLYQSDGTNLTG